MGRRGLRVGSWTRSNISSSPEREAWPPSDIYVLLASSSLLFISAIGILVSQSQATELTKLTFRGRKRIRFTSGRLSHKPPFVLPLRWQVLDQIDHLLNQFVDVTEEQKCGSSEDESIDLT
jgi:hypothetical protein